MVTLAVLAAVGLRVGGILRPFSVPTNAMSPAVKGGDHVLMRGRITPRRGDIIVFDTTDIPGLSAPGFAGQIYLKRLVGLPGETLRIADGQLYVDGQPMPMRNKEGEIHYTNMPQAMYLSRAGETVTVPADSLLRPGRQLCEQRRQPLLGFRPSKIRPRAASSTATARPERRGPVQ